jgi:sarcosine oxidase
MYDVIVLGTGGVGSAALLQLARRGLKVLGIDRFPPGHDRGSSHGESRIIRMAYFEHSDYVPLLRRAYELWNQLETEARRRLFHRVGLLEIGPPQGVVVPGVLKSAEQHGLTVETMDATQVVRSFPMLRMPAGAVAVYEPDAGYLLVEDCVVAHAAQATQFGAQIHAGETVFNWRATGDGVTVKTDRDEYRASRLVITAGAWSSQLLHDMQVPLRVVRKHQHWFASPPPSAGAWPCYLYELPHGVFYGFPEIRRGAVKMAEHTGGVTVDDPLTDSREPDGQDFQRVNEFRSAYLPDVGATALHHARCFYTLSPDEHFIVDRHPAHPQVVFAAGLSGHGFKFTPVLGEVLADLAIDGKTKQPIGFLAINRFAGKGGKTPPLRGQAT